MNQAQLIQDIENRAIDTYGSIKNFCRTIGKSEAWFSNIRAGRRELSFSNLGKISEALDITFSINVNGHIDYDIHELPTSEDLAEMLPGGHLKVHAGNYAGLWGEFMENNQLTDAEINIDELRDWIQDMKRDGVRIPDYETDTEMLKRVFYRYLREFDGQSISAIKGNRFPIAGYHWGFMGIYCTQSKSTAIPF